MSKRKRQTVHSNDIVFDPDARQEYLTGFRKRKLARTQQAREASARKAREAKLRERRQAREQRKSEQERQIEAVDAEFGGWNESTDEDDRPDSDVGERAGAEEQERTGGLSDRREEDASEAEFVDEDRYTTVTVEAMGADVETEADDSKEIVSAGKGNSKHATTTSRPPRRQDAPRAKSKKKFRYESKAERTATRQKQKAKNLKAKLRRKGN